MKILGIDPGTARLGWSSIEYNHHTVGAYRFGCITTDPTSQPEKRLLALYDALEKIISTENPVVASVEDIYFATNAKTVIPVGQARGIVLLACAKHDIPVVSYSPLTVKRAITGDGNADKKQMQYMLVKLLKLAKPPNPDDAADALALALTHAYTSKLNQRIL